MYSRISLVLWCCCPCRIRAVQQEGSWSWVPSAWTPIANTWYLIIAAQFCRFDTQPKIYPCTTWLMETLPPDTFAPHIPANKQKRPHSNETVAKSGRNNKKLKSATPLIETNFRRLETLMICFLLKKRRVFCQGSARRSRGCHESIIWVVIRESPARRSRSISILITAKECFQRRCRCWG